MIVKMDFIYLQQMKVFVKNAPILARPVKEKRTSALSVYMVIL